MNEDVQLVINFVFLAILAVRIIQVRAYCKKNFDKISERLDAVESQQQESSFEVDLTRRLDHLQRMKFSPRKMTISKG
jgi:CCR4-NOT transcriptional regulation complex NOT5 subunit